MAKLTQATKKPHNFSKEGRALKAQEDLKAQQAHQGPWIPVEAPITKTAAETPKTANIDKNAKVDPAMQAILDRIEKQDAEIKLLKGDADLNKDAKVKYTWPRKYSFSLYTRKPVLNIEYFLKDEEADLVYQNANRQWVENQYVRLTLLWGKVVETSNYLYNKNNSKSDHYFAKLWKGEDWETTYTFNEKPYGDFTVLSSKFIN